MFLGRRNQYCENDYATKCNLQINAIRLKLPMAFFTELEQILEQNKMETEKIPKSQSSLEKEWSCRNQPS